MKLSGVCYLTRYNNTEEFSSHNIVFEYAHMNNVDDDTELENQIVEEIKNDRNYHKLTGTTYYIYYEASYFYDYGIPDYKRNIIIKFINFEKLEE
jgi:hypothetical protein